MDDARATRFHCGRALTGHIRSRACGAYATIKSTGNVATSARCWGDFKLRQSLAGKTAVSQSYGPTRPQFLLDCGYRRLPEQLVNALAFVRSSPGRTPQRPEETNASFKPRFANAPKPAPIRTRISDRPSCSTGSTATIGIGHMVACKPTRLSVALVYQRITCCGSTPSSKKPRSFEPICLLLTSPWSLS